MTTLKELKIKFNNRKQLKAMRKNAVKPKISKNAVECKYRGLDCDLNCGECPHSPSASAQY